MAVAMLYKIPAATKESYTRVSDAVHGDGAPEGLLLHAAGPDDESGTRWIVEVWESDADSDRFARERVFPAFARYDVDPSSATRTRIEVDNLLGAALPVAV